MVESKFPLTKENNDSENFQELFLLDTRSMIK